MSQLRYWLAIALWTASTITCVSADILVEIDPLHRVDPSIPVIAAPVDFSAYLIDESTVRLAWNPILLDGSEVDYFNIWNNHSVIASTKSSQWNFYGINRNYNYDFSISAVTTLGEETRRSSRIYYDLPQLDADLPDGYNQYLPPLENLKAKVISEDSVELTWDAAPPHWSWADPSEYTYAIIVNGSYIDVVDEPSYIFTGLSGRGEVWVGVSARVSNILQSRQPQRVLADTSKPPGSVTSGVIGFNSLSGLRAEVYSSTAAELFWNINAGPAASHVYINGRLIARMNEGYSLFIDKLPPGERLLVSVGEGWPYNEGPQYSWILSYDYPLMHTWIEMPEGINTDIDRPTPPVAGLRAEAYSSSAVEVFWDRADAVLTRYRVYLDDEFIIETDAVSWYFDNLTADTESTVGVVALIPVGPNDNRSSDLVETSFKTFSEYRDPMVNCDVEGLVSIVYSSTTAEVFWDRGPAGSVYRLFHNGEIVDNTDATSWFIEGLEPASSHTVTVGVAHDSCSGQQLSVDFTMATSSYWDVGNNPNSDGSIINHANHVELISDVLRIFSGDHYTKALDQTSQFSIPGRNPDKSFSDVFDCESGSFEQEIDPTSVNAGVFFTFSFDQCVLGGETRNGYVSGQDGGRGLHFDTDQYSIWRNAENQFLYSGYVQKWRSQTGYFDRVHSFDTSNFSVEANAEGEVFTLSQMNTSFAYGSKSNGLDVAWLKGEFSAQLDVFGGSTFMVSTPTEFNYSMNIRTDGAEVDGVKPAPVPVSSEQRNHWTFASGQLDIQAEDGSSLQLDANNGDPATARVTISSGQGVKILNQPWSLWMDDLRFENYPDLTQ